MHTIHDNLTDDEFVTLLRRQESSPIIESAINRLEHGGAVYQRGYDDGVASEAGAYDEGYTAGLSAAENV